MEPKHTPAPWYVGEVVSDIAIGSEGKAICLLPSKWQNDNNVANAHLIAAAPDLLEALEEITETFKSVLGGSDPLYFEDFEQEINRAMQAINKAKGL